MGCAESEGRVTATCLLLWATWGASYTVYVYLLPRHAGASPGSGGTEPGQVRKEGSEPGRWGWGQQERGQMTDEGP